jgi:hypothetical protein
MRPSHFRWISSSRHVLSSVRNLVGPGLCAKSYLESFSAAAADVFNPLIQTVGQNARQRLGRPHSNSWAASSVTRKNMHVHHTGKSPSKCPYHRKDRISKDEFDFYSEGTLFKRWGHWLPSWHCTVLIGSSICTSRRITSYYLEIRGKHDQLFISHN